MNELNKKLLEVEFRTREIQARLEGCFRQMYSACTQMSLFSNIDFYQVLFVSAATGMDELSQCKKDYEKLIKESMSDTAANSGLN